MKEKCIVLTLRKILYPSNGDFCSLQEAITHHQENNHQMKVRLHGMKATGIVRRIDDLGRVVIPKEIRRTLRIREGDPLEIFVDREGEVILKKYSPISELGDFAKEYADALFDSLGHPVLICDRDEFIAVSGGSRKEYLNKSIGQKVEQAIQDRVVLTESNESTIEIADGIDETISSYVIGPIISGGDPIGCVMILSKEGEALTNVEQKAVETAASFLAKQME